MCAAFLVCGSIGAQKITIDKVPAPVASAFKSKYPTVTTASWKMEDGKNYAADFKMNNMSQCAKFNPSGGWMRTTTAIKTTELPAEVKTTVTKQFAGYTTTAANKLENADHSNGYLVTLTKGTDKLDVTLSAKGVVMSQEPKAAQATTAAPAAPKPAN